MASVTDYIKKMLDSAKVRKLRNELQPGLYMGSITGLTYERREKREKLGKAFWIDVVLDEAESVNGSEPTEAGTHLDFPILLEGANADMSFNDLKTFLVELTGCDPSEASAKYDELVDVINDEGKHVNPAGINQPARGMRVVIETYTRKTKTGKNAGKERTYPRWKRFDQSAADISANRKRLDDLERAAA